MKCPRKCGGVMERDDDTTNSVKVYKCRKCGARVYPDYPTTEEERIRSIRVGLKKEKNITIENGDPIYCQDCLAKGITTFIGYSKKGMNYRNQKRYCPSCKSIRQRKQWQDWYKKNRASHLQGKRVKNEAPIPLQQEAINL